MRPILPRNVPISLCAGAHCPTGPSKTRRPPKTALPTSFAKSRYPHNCRALQSKGLSTRHFEQVASLSRGSPSTNALSKAAIGSLRCSSHNSKCVFVLPKMSSLRAGSWYTSSLSVAKIQLFQCFSFYSFVDCLAERMPVHIKQRRPPSVVLNGVHIDEGLQCSITSSAPNVTSAAPSLMAACG